MPRGKGTPKTGGRQKGSPNRNRADLAEITKKIGNDPLIEMCKLYLRATDELVQFNILKEITSYVYQKLKAVEHTGIGPVHANALVLTLDDVAKMNQKILDEKK